MQGQNKIAYRLSKSSVLRYAITLIYLLVFCGTAVSQELHLFNLSGSENNPFPIAIPGSFAPAAVVQNNTGLQITVITDDRMLHVFNLSGSENTPFPVSIPGSGMPVGLSHNDTGQQIAVVTNDGQLHLFNLSGSENNPFPVDIPGSGIPRAVVLNNTGLQISVITDDRLLHLFNLSGTENTPFPVTIPGSGTPVDLAHNDTGQQIAVVTDDGQLHLFNLSGSENNPFPVDIPGSGIPRAVVQNNTGLQISVITDDRMLHVFNLNGSENTPFPVTIAGSGMPVDLAHNDTGQQIAVVTDDGQLHLFNLNGSENNPFPVTIPGGGIPGAVAQNNAGLQIAVVTGSGPVPVELTSFSAGVSDNFVILSWRTASESNNFGFDVEKSPDRTHFSKVGFLAGKGMSAIPQDYLFYDPIVNSGISYYRLKQVDTDGSFEYSDILEVGIDIPKTFTLEQNYPNPFNPETRIRLELSELTNVTLRIYNFLGREVTTLVDESLALGSHIVSWDGRDADGRQLPSGLYVYSLQADGLVKKRKMVLLR